MCILLFVCPLSNIFTGIEGIIRPIGIKLDVNGMVLKFINFELLYFILFIFEFHFPNQLGDLLGVNA